MRGESMAACGGRKRVSGATAGGWYKGLDADNVRQLCGGRLWQYFAGRRAQTWFAAICSRWVVACSATDRLWEVTPPVGRLLPVGNNGRAVAAKDAAPEAVAVVERAADRVVVVRAADNVVAKAANVRKRLSRPPNTAFRSPA